MVKFFIGITAVLLFLLEPIFALFSPFELNGNLVYIAPRFLILYLIFLSIYSSRRQAILYGLIFGLLYDVFYIDIIGLYTILYPLVCYVAGAIAKVVHQHLIISTFISLLLIAGLEFVVYQFNFLIGLTSMTMVDFGTHRLIATLLANLLFVAILVWVFKYLINIRVFSENA